MLVIDRRQQIAFVFRGVRNGKDADGIPVYPRPLPEAERPTFSCRLLTASEFTRVMDRASGAPGSAALDVVKWCLKGWAGLRNEAGEEVEFPGSSDKALEIMPGGVVIELGAMIVEASGLHETDRVK